MPADDLESVFVYLVLMLAVACLGLGVGWFIDKFDEMFDDRGWW